MPSPPGSGQQRRRLLRAAVYHFAADLAEADATRAIRPTTRAEAITSLDGLLPIAVNCRKPWLAARLSNIYLDV